MLMPDYTQMIKDAHARLKHNGDWKEFDMTIKSIKTLVPKKFFQGDDDPRLAKRVFYHQPFTFHWSGKAITDERAW